MPLPANSTSAMSVSGLTTWHPRRAYILYWPDILTSLLTTVTFASTAPLRNRHSLLQRPECDFHTSIPATGAHLVWFCPLHLYRLSGGNAH